MMKQTTEISKLLLQAEETIQPALASIRKTARYNQQKVLEAFWRHRVGADDLKGTTGYGLDDAGRDKFERVFADVFGAEQALVRPQIISGTHALSIGLFAALRPGDEIIFATGSPYDTLEGVVGIRQAAGSLAEWGVQHQVIPLMDNGEIALDHVCTAITERTRAVMFQKSRGYSARRAFGAETLKTAFAAVRDRAPDIRILVDNCYGEFVETEEPTAYGASLVMGSLIKNPGGGICTTGGYLAGDADLIESAASRLTAPGVGSEMGPSHDFLRMFYQGLYLAPHVVGQALTGSVLAAKVLADLGMKPSPLWDEARADIILSIEMPSAEMLLAFCQAVQSSAPIDSFVRPEAAGMAGYEDAVVMAAGTFVQGGSLELTADAPMRPPYTAYLQGGLTYEHASIAIERIAEACLSLLNKR